MSASPVQQPSHQVEGAGNRRASHGQRRNRGQRRARRQGTAVNEDAPRSDIQGTTEASDGWSVTAADDAMHDHLSRWAKKDAGQALTEGASLSLPQQQNEADPVCQPQTLSRPVSRLGDPLSGRRHQKACSDASCLCSVIPSKYSLQQVLVSLQVVAIGKCNHKAICAECILQMFMLYGTSQCALCKGELDQVLLSHSVITSWCTNYMTQASTRFILHQGSIQAFKDLQCASAAA